MSRLLLNILEALVVGYAAQIVVGDLAKRSKVIERWLHLYESAHTGCPSSERLCSMAALISGPNRAICGEMERRRDINMSITLTWSWSKIHRGFFCTVLGPHQLMCKRLGHLGVFRRLSVWSDQVMNEWAHHRRCGRASHRGAQPLDDPRGQISLHFAGMCQ